MRNYLTTKNPIIQSTQSYKIQKITFGKATKRPTWHTFCKIGSQGQLQNQGAVSTRSWMAKNGSVSCTGGEFWRLSWDVMSHHSFFQMIFISFYRFEEILLDTLEAKYTLESSSASISCKMQVFPTSGNSNLRSSQQFPPVLSGHPTPLVFDPSAPGFPQLAAWLWIVPGWSAPTREPTSSWSPRCRGKSPDLKITSWKRFFKKRVEKTKIREEKNRCLKFKHIGNMYQISHFDYDIGKHHPNGQTKEEIRGSQIEMEWNFVTGHL